MTKGEALVERTKLDTILPERWLYFYRITDSKYLNATLTEIRQYWSLRDIHDALRRIDFYEERERENAPKPKKPRHR